MVSRLAPRLDSLLHATRVISRPSWPRRVCFLLPRRISSPLAFRTYATPAKPKKGSVGATSKRATTRGAATKKTTAKSKSPAKKSATKTPFAAQKTAAAKRQAQKAATAARQKEKRQAAAVKAKAKAKTTAAAAKTRARKQAQETASATRLSGLRAAALSPPPASLRSGTYSIFVKAWWKNHASTGPAPDSGKAIAAEWHGLNDSQKESYKRRATEEHASTIQAQRDWVLAQKPVDILQANLARAELRKLKGTKAAKTQYREINDPRTVTRPPNAYSLFIKERVIGTTGAPPAEMFKNGAAEWKSLSATEKQLYEQQAVTARARYIEDYEQLYGAKPGEIGLPKELRAPRAPRNAAK